ncbi:smalltalk protein [Prevotella denticola]|uniref:smalltalk protein n=1 Tax=Prevotella denticola TaxID=28129 RepID=UPI0027E4CDBF|nr:smalltalk protein [Prevotella denticola]
MGMRGAAEKRLCFPICRHTPAFLLYCLSAFVFYCFTFLSFYLFTLMNKPVWKNVLNILISVLTALATTLGVSSCL